MIKKILFLNVSMRMHGLHTSLCTYYKLKLKEKIQLDFNWILYN